MPETLKDYCFVTRGCQNAFAFYCLCKHVHVLECICFSWESIIFYTDRPWLSWFIAVSSTYSIIKLSMLLRMVLKGILNCNHISHEYIKPLILLKRQQKKFQICSFFLPRSPCKFEIYDWHFTFRSDITVIIHCRSDSFDLLWWTLSGCCRWRLP